MSVILASILVLAQVQTVSFSSPVRPLREVVPELARATGQRLAVAPDVQWQLVYVRARDVPARDLLGKIARATYGRWVSYSEGSLTLELDKGRLTRAESEARKRRVADIKQALLEEIEDLKKPPEEGDFPEPSRATVIAILSSLGPDALAAIPIDGRVVYSNRPTAAQRPFPRYDPAWESELRKRENETRARAANRQTLPKNPEVQKIEQMLDPAYWEARKPRDTGIFSTQIVTVPFAKFDFVLDAEARGIMGTVSAYDETGLQQYFDGVGILWWPKDINFDEPEVKGDQTVVQLGPEASRFTDYWASEGRSTELFDAFKESPDPLLTVYTEIADQYAKTTDDNLVLNVKDRSFDCAKGRTTVQEIEDWLADRSAASSFAKLEALLTGTARPLLWEKANGWRVTAPEQPPVGFDRTLLRGIHERLSKPVVSLDDRGWLAAKVVHPYPDVDRQPLEWLIDLSSHRHLELYMPLLKVYGLLPTPHQKRLREGQPLTVRSMAPDAKAILRSLCDGSTRGIDRLWPGFRNEVRDYVTSQQQVRNFIFSTMDEPTISSPDGLSNDAIFSLNLSTVTAYVSAGGPGWIGSGDGIDLYRLAGQYIDLQVDEDEVLKDRDLIETKHERAVFTFETAPGIGSRDVITIRVPGSGDRAVRLSALGEDFQKLVAPKLARRKQYEAYLAAMKKHREGGERVTSYELRVTSYELRVTSYELRVTSYELRVMRG